MKNHRLALGVAEALLGGVSLGLLIGGHAVSAYWLLFASAWAGNLRRRGEAEAARLGGAKWAL